MDEDAKAKESTPIDTLYDVSLKVLDNQIELVDRLDNKVRGIFALITLIYGGLAAFLSSQPQKLSSASVFLFWIVLAVFIAVVVFTALAYWVKGYDYLIRGRPLADMAKMGLANYAIKSYFLRKIGEQHEFNNTILEKKARHAKWVLWLAFVNVLLILSLLVIQIFPSTLKLILRIM